MQLSKWLRANVDFAFQAVFPAVRAVSLLIFIIPQGNRKVYYFLQDFIFFHKILLLSAPHRFTAFASDLGQIQASEGRNAAADWAERGKQSAGYSGGCAASVPIAFSYVFCIACRKSGAFAPQKCIRSNHSASRATYAQPKQKSHSLRNDFLFWWRTTP